MARPLILVVDDEKEMADDFVKIIEKTGRYEAIAAYSAREAFEQIKKYRKFLGLAGNAIKLILLDIKMPEMDGLQFLKELRKNFGDEKMGALMVSAYEDLEKWDKATDGFVVGYLKKPIVEQELMSAIGRFFSNPEERYNMTMETFGKHIDKMSSGEFEKTEQEKS